MLLYLVKLQQLLVTGEKEKKEKEKELEGETC